MDDHGMIITPPRTRLILVADSALDVFGSRTHDGHLLKFSWGEPNEHGWYKPTLTAFDDGWLEEIKREAFAEGFNKALSEIDGNITSG